LVKKEVEHSHHLNIDVMKRYGAIWTTITSLKIKVTSYLVLETVLPPKIIITFVGG
jgi:hypothetical protein